ncbi:MAG: exo-alpha-sialidase [Myxococcales bacterium FL481]|nr:MAG: exo-alpha-sialidase [Myxococcales bacterium FL481]
MRIDDDTSGADQMEVVLALGADGVVLAGWIDYRSGTRCGFTVSRDGGETWEPSYLMEPLESGFTGDPAVAVDSAGTLYIACQNYEGNPNRILFARSLDDGETWTDTKEVQVAIDKPWLAAGDDGTVYLTWLGGPGGFKRTTDGGDTWESVISLGSLGHGTGISIGEGGIVHVAWNYNDARVYYARSDDHGATLSSPEDLGPMGMPCYGCDPRDHPIVSNASDPTGETVAIAWSSTMPAGESNDDVWAIISKDGGETWSDTLRVSESESGTREFQPWVAVDASGATHVVWTDARDNQNAVYHASAEDPADGFGTNTEVTDATGPISGLFFYGDYKGIVIDGDDVLVAWADSRDGNTDIYFSRGVNMANRSRRVKRR